MPEQIKPWIDLLSWQLLAFLGGVALLPAIYIFVLRIRSVGVGNSTVVLTRDEAQKINLRSTQEAEDRTPQEAAQSIVAVQNEQDPADLRERVKNAITLWDAVRILVRARAHLVEGGKNDLRSTIANLERIANGYPDFISSPDVKRAASLQREVNGYIANPISLTEEAYRSFKNRAGRLARKVEAVPMGADHAVPPPN